MFASSNPSLDDRDGVKIVLANGCYDPLHPGHVTHLEEAAEFGSHLIVSLTLDEFVHKGPKRPYLKWAERALMLRALRCVDLVVPSRNAWEAIREQKPNVFVKGGDWEGRLPLQTIEACNEVGAEIRFTKSQRFGTAEMVRRLSR